MFLAPDRAWLSPFGHADRMVAAASQPLLLDARPEPSGAPLPRNLDVVAPRPSARLLRDENIEKFYDFGFSSFSASGGRVRAPGPPGVDPG